MRYLRIRNYIITESIKNILLVVRSNLTNGKLREIKDNIDNLVVTCPSRDHKSGMENSADCNIYIGNNEKIPYGFARCFACGFTATFPKFVGECFNASERFGEDWLIEHFGILQESSIVLKDSINISKVKKTANFLDKSILDSFQNWTPYLEKRHLSRRVCEEFSVKYDQYTREVIFPCFDEHDNLIMLPKRSIDTKTFYLDKSVEKPIYCLGKINKEQIHSAMLVEGPIDCLTCWSNDVPAIACLGSISSDQIKKINKSCIKFLYIATDNDEAGEKFRAKLKIELSKKIIITDVRIPNGKKDVNDLNNEEWIKLKENFNLPIYKK